MELSPGHYNVIRSAPASLTQGSDTTQVGSSQITLVLDFSEKEKVTAVKAVSRAEKTFQARYEDLV